MIAEAMDNTVISVTTENIFPDGKMQHNSTGDAVPSGLLSLSKSDEKVHWVPSRYLRPSMASCHDYCKYGKKRDSEATRQDLRAFLKKKLLERRQDHLETPCVEERRKRTVIKPKMEPESKSESGSSVKSEFSKPKSPSPSPPLINKNVTFREKKTLLSSRYGNEVKNLNQDHEKKTKFVKKWIPRQPKSTPDKPGAINLPFSEEGASQDADIMKGDTESVSEPMPSVAPKEIKSRGSEAGGSEVHCVITENTKSRRPKSSADKPGAINLPFSEVGASKDANIMKGDTESVSEPMPSVAPKEIKSRGSEAGDSEVHCVITENTKSRQPKSSADKLGAINLPFSEEGASRDPDIMTGDTESVGEPIIPSIAPKEIKSHGSEAGDSEVHCVITEDTKSVISEPTVAATPKAVNKKTAPSVKQQQKIKQKAPLPLKHVDVAVRSAIVLKTKTPLIRSLSRRKSSRSLIARSRQEKKLSKSLGTSRFEGAASKPANNLGSKAPHLRFSISQFARRNQESITRSPDSTEIEEDTASTADTVKTRTPVLVKSVSKPKPSWCPVVRRNQESKITKSLSTSNIIERKLSKASPASFDGVSSLKPGRLSSLKDATSVKSTYKLGEINSKKKSEDSVFGTDHENEYSKSATNKLSSVETEGNNKIEGNTKTEVSRGEYTRGVRRTSTARVEESTTSTPYRLKYRRRKSIDFRSTEFRSDSIGARRLWFRIGKMAADNPNSSSLSWRRSFKKKDMGSPKSNLLNSEAPNVVPEHQDVDEEEVQALFTTRKMSGENPSSGRFSWRRRSFKKKKDMESSDSTKLPKSEPQIVVLKHQDAAEKKEAQALFNHVIEETASKLVESRKSKVKALVGAFESVISLQERKPASAL